MAKLPTIKELSALVRTVKDYVPTKSASDAKDYVDPLDPDGTPTITLTIGWSDKTDDWSYQTGDNSFTGGAYGYPIWAVVYVSLRCDSRELARDIRAQLDDQVMP
jgi:hypothetical protein